jgi:transcription-repair coupling factor (superfamily II helicase)
MTGKALGDLVGSAKTTLTVFVARDGRRLAEVEQALRFFAPDIEVLEFPAWDCLPYDRVSPHPAVVARRMATLTRLTEPIGNPTVLLTTVNAILQRVPPRAAIAGGSLVAKVGDEIGMDALVAWLEGNGFTRTATVREAGEYAVRGGILDLFAANSDDPLRLDFFGNALETVRTFDADTQRTTGERDRLQLTPVSEMVLTPEVIAHFRQGYVAEFGTADRTDLFYQAISEGRRYAGMEHWLPLFLGQMDTLFDFIGDAPVVLDHLTPEAHDERLEQIADHYAARKAALDGSAPGAGGAPYKPLPPDRLYLTAEEWDARLAARPVVRVSPFAEPDARGAIDAGGRAGRNFSAERAVETVNVFDAVIAHIRTLASDGKRVVVACFSEGSRDRMGQVLVDHGLITLAPVEDWPAAAKLAADWTALAVLGVESGFVSDAIAVIGEQDILGDRLVRSHKRRRAADFLSDVTTLAEGDLVVHIDHGIGRFRGLKTIEAAGAPHDCLEILYADNNRVYLPVENIELLSRYGSQETDVPLDRLGGVAWQNRRARMKQRLREMAAQLIKIAAARATKKRRCWCRRKAPTTSSPRAFLMRKPRTRTRDRGGARRPRRRTSDGPAHLRRRRLRQDGGRTARRLRHRDGGQAGGGGGADDPPCAPALQDLPPAVRRDCR